MRTLILLVVSVMLTTNLCSGQSEFKKHFFTQINLSNYSGFQIERQSHLLNWERSSFTTFNIGLGYEYYQSRNWNISSSITIGWIKDVEKTKINDPNFNEGNQIVEELDSGSDVSFVLETRFIYNNLMGKRLSGYIAPTINFNLFDDVGNSSTNGVNLNTNYNFNESRTIRNRILRPSITGGLTYKFNSERKMTLSAFYTYSLTPLSFGEWEYTNSLGFQENGDWQLNGHQIGLSFQIFPFFKRKSN